MAGPSESGRRTASIGRINSRLANWHLPPARPFSRSPPTPRLLAHLGIAVTLLLTAAAATLVARGDDRAPDAYHVRLAPGARDTPASGRVILFFLTPSDRQWRHHQPVEGPFWEPAQPIASVAVERLAPGETVVIGADAVSFPAGLDDLHGPVRVQAVLDADETERSFLEGPGNVIRSRRASMNSLF